MLVFSACVANEPAVVDGMAMKQDAGTPERNPILDLDLDGYSPADGDCDDDDPTVGPDEEEICDDGIDQDCQGGDLNCLDADGDGDGFTPREGDCDDADPVRRPGRPETCDDGVDQDCDGRDLPCNEEDRDGDGVSPADGDCDDGNRRIRPGIDDICGNGIDEDCSGGDAVCEMNPDSDGDSIPDAEDVCPEDPDPIQGDRDGDGVGDLCDNCLEVQNADQADSDEDGVGDVCDEDVDQDGDGFSGADGDCNPADGAIHPGAEERCNEVDDDCNGFVDDGCPSDLRTETVRFEGGPSLMGSLDADPETCLMDPRSDENCDEVPQRQYELQGFSMEIHEVTNVQYRACMAAERCSPPAVRDFIDDPAFDDHPVVWVNQVQGSAYCAWAGGHLPTEAQWERAARGDAPLENRRFPWGDDPPAGCEQANVNNCSAGTSPVRQAEGDVTADGALGFAGNVHEIVDGWYDPVYYRRAPMRNPSGPDAPTMGSYIPIRGGSYRSSSGFSTITFRGFRHLVTNRDERRDIGFRCVR